jgi:hypothetical protein
MVKKNTAFKNVLSIEVIPGHELITLQYNLDL